MHIKGYTKLGAATHRGTTFVFPIKHQSPLRVLLSQKETLFVNFKHTAMENSYNMMFTSRDFGQAFPHYANATLDVAMVKIDIKEKSNCLRRKRKLFSEFLKKLKEEDKASEECKKKYKMAHTKVFGAQPF